MGGGGGGVEESRNITGLDRDCVCGVERGGWLRRGWGTRAKLPADRVNQNGWGGEGGRDRLPRVQS